MSSLDKYKAAAQSIRAAKEEAKKVADTAIREAFAEIFARYPKLVTFSWTQYTPGFNDGDPCYFSAHVDDGSIKVNGVSRWDDDEEIDEDSPEKLEETERDEIAKAISSVLEAFEEEDLQKLFDEGRVVVTKGNIETLDYYHD